MQERRKFRRTQAKEKTALESKEGKSHEGMLVDISPSGMRIISESNIHLGSQLSGKFKILPNSGNFYVLGEVAWIKPAGKDQPQGASEIGIKFSKVSTIPIN